MLVIIYISPSFNLVPQAHFFPFFHLHMFQFCKTHHKTFNKHMRNTQHATNLKFEVFLFKITSFDKELVLHQHSMHNPTCQCIDEFLFYSFLCWILIFLTTKGDWNTWMWLILTFQTKVGVTTLMTFNGNTWTWLNTRPFFICIKHFSTLMIAMILRRNSRPINIL
jgi:hypothetical protein